MQSLLCETSELASFKWIGQKPYTVHAQDATSIVLNQRNDGKSKTMFPLRKGGVNMNS